MFTKFTRTFCVLLCMLAMVTMSVSKASATGTTLTRGQIAIVSFSGISGGTHFSFVTWVDLAPGTVINFTTNPFLSTGSANAASNAAGTTSIVRWQNTEGSAIPAGTVISLYKGAGEGGTDVCTRGSQTAVASTDNVGANSTSLLNINTAGRAIFAYQGSDYSANSASISSPVTFNGTILFGLCYQGTGLGSQGSNAWIFAAPASSSKSFCPSELGASSSYNINNLGVKAVDGQYTGPRTGAASLAAYQAMVTNPANWTVTSVNATPSTVDYSDFSAPVPITASISATNVTCNGGTDGSATVTASGGTTPYTYSWAPSGGTAATATGLSANTYTCTITDATSASITKTVTVTQPAALSVSGTNTLCATTTLTASMSGGTWSSSNTSVATVGSTGVVTGVAAGTATISYVHTCGTATRGVTVNLANPGTIGGLQTVCATAFIAHSTTGTTGGTWVSSNTAVGTISSTTGTMGGVEGSAPGTTTVSYTVTNSCGSMTATIVNTVYPLSDPGVISGSSSMCAGATATLASSTTSTDPFYTHTWASSATAIATVNAATGVVTGMSAGTSRISYTASGCGNFRTFFTMNVLPTSVSTITGTTTVTAGSTTTLSNTTAGGTWSSTNTAAGTVSTTGVVTGIAAGTTTISYLISNSCGTSAATVNVTVIGPLSATQSQTNVTCNGGSDGFATVTASGGTPSYTYSWAPSGGTNDTATGLAAGSYTCTITDAASASITKTFTITEPAALSVTGTNTLCATTTLTASLSGGTWSSDNTSVATVGSTGVVTGVAAGTATISYVHSCGTATRGVTVNLANPGIIGGLQTVCATAFIAHSTTGTAGGTWVSSNTAVGTINSATGTMGGVMGSATATTTISYTVTNSCGSMTATIVNTVYPLTDPGTISGGSSVCVGANVTLASSSTTTSIPPYSHAWSSSATAIATVNAATGVVTGMSNGTSRITYTATGCGTFRTFMTMNVLPTSVSTITGTTTVVAGSTTTLSNTVSGGTWSSTNTAVGTVSTSGVVTGIAAGTTTISYLISNSCGTFAATVNVTVLSSFDVTQSQTNVTCNGGSNGAASVLVTGGTPPYTYTWVGGSAASQTTSTASGLSAGSYTCTVTDVASNSAVKTFTITEPSAITSSVSAVTNVSCNGLSNGAATISASGGTPSYSYSWAPSGGTAATATGLAAGTYTVTITDANSCTKTQTVTISQPSVLTSSVSAVTNVSCNGLSNGAATISASGGTPSYSYSWAPSGGTAATATGLAAGTYTVTITDANSCTKTQTVTISQPSVLTSSVSAVTNVSCNGLSNGAATISASGGTPSYSYSWAPSGGTAATATGLAAGTYTVTITDANSCTKTQTVTISQPSVITSSVSAVTNVSCNGLSNGAATISASGGTPSYSYSWAPSGGTAATATGLATGTYTVTITDANSCTKTQTVTISQPSVLTSSVSAVTNVSCNGLSNGAATISASGGTPSYSYSWAPGGGTAATATGLAAGTYTVTITDANSCTKTQTVTISQPSVLTSSVSAVTNVSCNGLSNGAATIAASGGTPSYSYSWAPSGGTAATATGLAAGTYTVTITDANSCTKTQTVTISQPSVITSSVSSVTNVSCNGLSNGAATVSVSGGTPSYTYSWAPTGGAPSIVGASTTATSLAAGTYTVTITDANGCTKTQTVTISQPSVLSSSVSAVTNVSCNGLSNGAATISASGGTPSYSYSWAPSGGTAATATGLAAGTYTVTITDANSCTKTQTVTISQPSVLTSSVSSVTNATCNGLSNGAATVSASGGTPSYSYSWAPSGGTAATATGLAAGTYTVTITDANSCTKTQTVTITQPSAVVISSTTSNSPVCVGSSLNFNSTVSGGTTPYSYSWNGPSSYSATGSAPSITSVTAAAGGIYTLSVTDGNGCTAAGLHTTSAAINTRPVITSIGNSGPVCATFNLNLTSTASSGATPYSYSWSGPNSFASTLANPVVAAATTSATGTYTLNVTDANGCTVASPGTTSAVVNPRPVITSIGNNSPVCTGVSLNFTSAASGGTGTLSYAWAGPGTFTAVIANPTIASAVTGNTGVYTLTVTDGLGCHGTGTNTISATVNARPALSAIGNNGPICASNTLNLTRTVTGGTTPYGYAWSGPNTFSSTASAPSISGATTAATGVYTLVITDANGCTATGTNTTSATVNPRPAVSSISNNGPICSGLTLNLNSTSGGGTGTLSYSWSGPNTFSATTASPSISSATAAATGTYTLTVTDINSCTATGTRTTTATVNDRPVIASISNDGPVCSGNTLDLMSTVTGGTAPLVYAWSGPNSFAATTANTSITAATTAATGTYTLVVTDANGCIPTSANTTAATVNPLPAAISGNANICIGLTTTLSNATGTGTWSSSAPATASVDASGVVTGNIVGNATISYTLSTGCYMTREVSVNPFPSAISGPTAICAGANITLTNTLSGGSWSSSNTTVATIDANSGVVTGLAAGTVNFSYTSDKGCMVSTASPITNMISAIAGASGSCIGLNVALSDATTGGLWTSANSTIASVGSATGLVTANSGGSTTITYTVGSCYRVQPMGIATAPPDITGGTEICIGATTTLSNTFAGGTWYRAIPSSFVADVTYTGGVVTGVGAGTVIISYILSVSCITTTVVTVDPTPVITGSTAICNGTTSALTSSISGGTWSTNNASVATISASGIVTAVSVGSVYITYTPPTGCYKTQLITVVVAPAPITGPSTICIGTTATFSDATGGGLGWTSSNASVASIGSNSGVATGITTGTATITFTLASGGCVGTKTVTVTPLPDVITGTATVCGGSTTTLTSAPAGGTWITSAASVATVGTSGVVSGVAAGTATIYYSLGVGCNRGQVVTVNAQPAAITGVTSLCVGSSATMASTTSGGTWTSSNTSAATINSSTGLASGVGTGTTTISYTLSSGCNRTAAVTVSTINATTGNAPLCVGQTETLSNATTGGSWLSSNAGVASVSTSGIVTGVAGGNATISYVLSAGCVSTTAATVNTSPATISGTMNVSVGSTTTLSDATSGGTWASSNPSLGSVDATTGVVAGIAEGTITITYTASGCYRTTAVTVNPALPPIPGPLSLCVGGTVTLPPPVIGLSWTSSDTTVATIGIISGVVNGISPGTTTITFTFYSGATVTKVMTVYPIPAAITGPSSVCAGYGITLADANTGGTWQSGSTVVATIGTFSGIVTGAFAGSTVVTYTLNGCTAMKQISVNAIPGTFTLANNICVGTVAAGTGLTAGTTWISSDPSVASITSAGTMTGTGAGTTTISYAFASTGCARTQVVSVNTMAANTGMPTACTGATTTLSNASAGGTWSSSATTIATVGTSGIVTGVASGNAVITYTYTPGCKAYTTVTVLAGPAVISGVTSVCPGSTVTLTDATGSGTWSSSDGTTATVGSATGVVNGIATGAATISYTIANGCYKAMTMVVKALPAAITGSNTVCKSLTASYTDASGAGAWTSSNAAIGTIGASSGVLTGIAAGTTNITFTSTATTCSITKTVTVNTAGTITGPLTVSKAASLITPAAYSSTVTGGVWSTSSALKATIGGSTGLLTGVSAGAVNVLYTANGCLSGLAITITTPREGGNNPVTEQGANSIELFPNPTSGTFTIRSSASGTFSMYTLEGKGAGQYTINTGDNVVSMPKDFAAGIYMCRFTGEDGNITMVRLVYQP